MSQYPELRKDVPLGQLHGPGIVAVPAEMRAAAASLGLAPPPVHQTLGAKPTLPQGHVIDADTVRFLVLGLVSNKPEIQKYIVENYTVPDVEFVNVAGSVRGREDFYNVYRTATGTLNYHITFRDIILEHVQDPSSPIKSKAAVWVDLKVKPHLLPVNKRAPMTCIVILHFAVDPLDGRTKVSYQVDHYSVFINTWYGGVLAQQLQEAFLRPALGKGLAMFGRLLDLAKNRLRASWTSTKQKHGQVLGVYEPASNGSTVNGVPVSRANHILSPHEDMQMRQAVAVLSRSMVDVEYNSGWQSRGILGKTVQLGLGVVGLWWAVFATAVAMILNALVTLLA